ncbi:hypothetical protein RUM44_013491 [Polyplax serrata]|uniref:Ion transport domain-containing protein n=1 Tax=Polyplax serrata TaxID=468196 RepID=A0ABR1BEB9_POLSC
MDGNFDNNFRRTRFGRSISFQKELTEVDSMEKHKTITPSLLSRLKSFREDRSMMQRVSHIDLEDSSTSALDDIIFLESFEEAPQEDVNVIVSRDGMKQNIMETMKSGAGNVKLLNDIETGNVTQSNVEEFFKDSTAFERNVAFLWSVFHRRRDLLDFFFNRGVDVNFCENQQNFGALHLSAFSGCNNCTSVLISKGADVNALSSKYTPLHCAAFGDSASTAKLLITAGAKIIPEKGCSETPVHSAVRSKAVDCLQLFTSEPVDMNNMGEYGFSPLHLAADLGYVPCLKILLDSHKCDVNLQSVERKCSALHIAAENGYAECVKLLLEFGADVNSVNYRQQCPLHAAAKVCVESVELLLKYGADPNSPDADNRTPMHTAVCKSESEHSLEIIETLSMWRGDVNRRDKYGYTPLHIAALNELSECVECLILQGSDVTTRTRGGTSALSIISRKTPAAISAIHQKLDESIAANDPDASKEVVLMFNFRYLLRNCKKGEVSFLQTLVDEGQKEILGHPLCEAFLHLKWQKIRKYYITRLIFCLIYVVLLSLYVLTALAYQCYNDSVSDVHPDAEARILIIDPELCTKKSYFGDLLRRNPIIMEMEWFFLAFITVLEVCRKIYGFRGYNSFRHYISQKGNIVEWCVVFSVFLVSFIYTGRTYTWQNHVGAFAVLCGWANMMVMIGNLPIFGSYVAMYTRVQKEFTKLFMAYICLLIGFTVCFCVIFPKAKPFSNPFVAIIKILVMMTGELEFDGLLENITQEDGHSASLLEISALTTFVFFLLFVTIILMNLLIGIAVHDIQGLQKTAVLSKLVGQTKLITHIESALFNGCLPNCFLKLLQITALISPSAYRVVVSVKPLNPRETRLPQEVMRSALEIAKQKRVKVGSYSSRSSMRSTTLKKRKTVLDEEVLKNLQDSVSRLLDEILFPLLVSEMLNKVDFKATVEEGGPVGQAGAIRYGLSRALGSLVSPAVLLKMKVAGLLQNDVRRRERKKPGKEGARRRYTWLKR